MSGDDEFDEFLARRKPLFQRPPAHEFEPPEDVDRLVLRQAREAIKPSRHLHEIRGPGWGMPLALAATVLVTVTIVLNVMVPRKVDNTASDVHQVAQRLDSTAPSAAPAPMAAEPAAPAPARVAAHPSNNPAHPAADAPLADLRQPAAAPVVESAPGFAAEEEAARYATTPPPPARPYPRAVTQDQAATTTVVMAAPPPSEAQRAVAKATSTPVWRRDAQSWLTEIDKLRAQGKNAEADAEMAEYKRQHRAYAASPDR